MKLNYYNFKNNSNIEYYDDIQYYNRIVIQHNSNYEKLLISKVFFNFLSKKNSVIDIFKNKHMFALLPLDNNLLNNLLTNLNEKENIFIDNDIIKAVDNNIIFLITKEDFNLLDDEDYLDDKEIEDANINIDEVLQNYCWYFNINLNEKKLKKIIYITEMLSYPKVLLILEFLRKNNFDDKYLFKLSKNFNKNFEAILNFICESEKLSFEKVIKRLQFYTKKEINMHLEIDHLFEKYFNMFLRYENKKYIINSDLANIINNFYIIEDIKENIYEQNKKLFDKLTTDCLLNDNQEIITEIFKEFLLISDNQKATDYAKNYILNMKFLYVFSSCAINSNINELKLLPLLKDAYFEKIKNLELGRATKNNYYSKYRNFLLELLKEKLNTTFLKTKKEFVKNFLTFTKIDDYKKLPKEDIDFIEKNI